MNKIPCNKCPSRFYCSVCRYYPYEQVPWWVTYYGQLMVGFLLFILCLIPLVLLSPLAIGRKLMDYLKEG